MQIINWIKFLWALYGLYPEAKKLWDDVNTQYKIVKGAPPPSVADFKKLVTDSFAQSMTDVSQVQTGLQGDGTVK